MLLNRPKFIPLLSPENGKPMVDAETKQALFRLSEDMVFIHTDGTRHIVYKTEVNDGGSVPSQFHWFLHPHDERFKHDFALHDSVWHDSRVSKWKANLWLFYCLRCSGIPLWHGLCVLLALTLFGRKTNKPRKVELTDQDII